MKTGLIISGTAHVLLLLLAIFRLPFFNPEPPVVPQVTDVTLLTAAELAEALRLDPPEIMADIDTLFAPSVEENDAERPDDQVAPEQTEFDVTEAPSERDSDADISGAFILAQPDVEVEAVVIEAPSFEAPESPTFGLGTDGNTATPTLSPSLAPRAAPRVDAFASPSLNISTTSDIASIETTSDEPVEEPLEEPVEEQEPAEQPDAVAEILPEAVEDGSDSAAPPRASTPPRRSNRIADIQAEIEGTNEPEVELEVEPEVADVEPEDSGIGDLISGLEEPAPTSNAPKLTAAQERSISSIVGTALQQTWNKLSITGKPNFEQLIIQVEAVILPDGTIVTESIRPISPANPTGDFQVAYEAARRALLRTARFNIPTADIPEGLTLTLTFDPSKELAGLN